MIFQKLYLVFLYSNIWWVKIVSWNQPMYRYDPTHSAPQLILHPLSRIPHNIPNDTITVTINHNNIKTIRPGPLKHLKRCTTVSLGWNKISKIEPKSFWGMEKLETLNLNGNQLQKLNAYTFEGLHNLKMLIVENNKLTNIDPNAFYKLKHLQTLALGQNDLLQLHNGTLSHSVLISKLFLSGNPRFIFSEDTWNNLKELRQLHLNRRRDRKCNQRTSLNENNFISENSFNELKALIYLMISNYDINILHENTFKNQLNLKTLYLGCNSISDIRKGTFSNLKKLRTIFLFHNCLSSIDNYMFSDLTSLGELHLRNNQISHIERFAFKGNTNLRNINLIHNNLTYLNKKVFHDLYLKCLDLSRNKIHTIEPESISLTSNIKLVLRQNPLISLAWNVFKNQGDIKHKHIKMMLDAHFIKCTRHNCWIFDGIDAGWITLFVPGSFKPQPTPSECRSMCPTKEACMESDDATCLKFCTNNGYNSGILMLDYDVCPFQQFCKCRSCLKFSKDVCKTHCSKQNKIPASNATDEHGCPVCICQCEKEDCASKCSGRNYELVSSLGCRKCKCLLLLSQDESISNEPPTDTSTVGRNDQNAGDASDAVTKTAVISVAATFLFFALIGLIFQCIRKIKQHRQEETEMPEADGVMELDVKAVKNVYHIT